MEHSGLTFCLDPNANMDRVTRLAQQERIRFFGCVYLLPMSVLWMSPESPNLRSQIPFSNADAW
jgi:hypothetical protein